ncbi:MAG: BolA family protein [Gammaproteobacteria bacterium]
MKVQSRIEEKLVRSLNLEHFEVINESARHNVPPGSESHFKVIVVSDHFTGMSLLSRHRVINDLLAEELAGPVHALSIHPYTRQEWLNRQQEARVSPPCLGGEKRQS